MEIKTDGLGNYVAEMDIDVLNNLKTRPNFEEMWPNEYKQGWLEGKLKQEQISQIRRDYKKTTLEFIFEQDKRLYDWWEGLG